MKCVPSRWDLHMLGQEFGEFLSIGPGHFINLKIHKKKSRDYVSGIWELIKVSVNATSLSHYLHTDILNTLRQNDRHFADVFKCIFFDRSVWLSIKMPLKFLPKGPINNKPILVQIMASHRTIIWTNDGLIYWHTYASLGLDEWILQTAADCMRVLILLATWCITCISWNLRWPFYHIYSGCNLNQPFRSSWKKWR